VYLVQYLAFQLRLLLPLNPLRLPAMLLIGPDNALKLFECKV